MLKSYFKIAWRSLLKDRRFTFLNLLGLSIGLACAVLIYMWVNDELSMDRFQVNDSRLYQVLENDHNSDRFITSDYVSGPLAETLTSGEPEVASAVPVSEPDQYVLSQDDNNIKATGIYAGQDYYKVFSFPLLQGQKEQVLAAKSSIVLSEGLAMKLFHATTGVIGKTISFQHSRPYLVSGVFKNLPASSSTQYDFVLSFEEFKELNPNVKEWKYTIAHTYLLLKEGANIDNLNKKLSTLFERKTGDSSRILFARRYSEGYLYGKYENGKQAGGRIEYVRMFSMIAIFILAIACINFMNLSTARASTRMKEVGIKKTMGARRGMLAFQFLSESVLMTLLSMILALVIVWLFLPRFNEITGKQMTLQFTGKLILSILSIVVCTGIVAGSYPALYLSGFNPVNVLKGKLATSIGQVFARKGLVVFQFTLSVVLIIAVLVIYKQMDLIQHKNLGYSRDHIIYFNKEGKVNQNMDAFLSEVKKLPGVVNASSIGQSIVGGGLNTIGDLGWEGKKTDDKIVFEIRPVNYDMIEMLGIGMAKGQSFSRKFGTEDTKLIFNETAVKEMGLKDPIGKVITIQGGKFEILGVVKDFHFASLHEKVNPLFFILRPDWTGKVMVKLAPGNESANIEAIRRFYTSYNPGYPLEYKFLDEDYQAQYVSERRVSILSRYFAILAIIISCLGLFGLAAFTAQRRQKEIGIRKVVGATVRDVIILLSTDFLKWILIAVLIAFPLAWLGANQWLNGFAYRVTIGPGIFLIAGFATMLITLVTISFQSIKTALANPVRSLRAD